MDSDENFFLTEPLVVKKDNLVKTWAKWGGNYNIKFDIKVSKRGSFDTYYSIMHFTTNGNCCGPTERIPGLWLHYKEQQRAYFYIATPNGLYEHGMDLDKWYSIEVNQLDGTCTLKMNGETKWSTNVPSLEYSNVKYYLSDPWHNSAEYDSEGNPSNNWIEMKNLKIQNGI